jgi:hypothetical protein
MPEGNARAEAEASRLLKVRRGGNYRRSKPRRVLKVRQDEVRVHGEARVESEARRGLKVRRGLKAGTGDLMAECIVR